MKRTLFGLLAVLIASTTMVSLAVEEFAAPVASTPAGDLRQFRAHFQKKLPTVPLSEFVNGTYSLDEQAYKQWRDIEEFPPYEISIERGKQVFVTPFANGVSYSDCFKLEPGDIRKYYPYFHEGTSQVRTLLQDLLNCRTQNGEPALSYQSGELIDVAAYLTSLARGQPIRVLVTSDAALESYSQGKRVFFMKRGQMNFSCADCHVYNAGNSLSGQILSPAIGQVSHFPAYRSGWQGMGSLHRRYAQCMEQIGAEPYEAQSREFRELEFFHAYLSTGLKINGPGYRK